MNNSSNVTPISNAVPFATNGNDGRRSDGTFLPGHGGRPKGSRNKRTMLYNEVIEPNIADVLGKVVSMALEGNEAMLGLLFKQYAPPELVKISAEEFDGKDGVSRGEAILKAMFNGEITPDEASKALKAVNYHETAIRAQSDRDLVDRILEGAEK